jgi:hypothetical protein
MTEKEQAYQELNEAENELFTLKQSPTATPATLKKARAKVAEAYARWLTFNDDDDNNNDGNRAGATLKRIKP